MTWRNDPATRRNSLSTEVVTLETHLRWLDKVLNDTRRELFVAELDDEAVGTVRLDYAEDACELSWTVAPEFRGRGLGSRMVALAIEHARCPRLIARIKAGNEASERLARALGFTAISATDDETVWSRAAAPSPDTASSKPVRGD